MSELTLQQKLLKIQQDLKVPKSNFNKFGNFYYRSTENILEAVKPMTEKYNLLLTLTDEVVCIGDKNYIKATATLEDDEETFSINSFAREADIKKGMDDSQITGSTSSYARKYALNGMFLIDDTKDADTDEYQSQTRGNNNELNNQIVTLFAQALNKVGGHDELYKLLDFNKSKMTALTKSDDADKKEQIIKKLEEIINGD